MVHGVMCQGTFEANARTLVPGSHSCVEGGVERPLPPWPDAVDGIRFGALDRRNRLLVVRIAFDDLDVVLHSPIVLDAARHLGGGRRPGQEVALIGDEPAERLLDDILASNTAQTNAIALVVNRVNQVRRASREAAARAAGTQR